MSQISLHLDQIDVSILKELYFNSKTCTSTFLAKNIFKGVKDEFDLRNKNVNVIQRLRKLSKYNLLNEKKEEGKSIFSINPENVIFDEGKMRLKKIKNVFLFKTLLMIKPNGGWILYQLDSQIEDVNSPNKT